MRRRAIRSNTDGSVSLFPFLAVLICTMGSLIVLLVVVMQQARAQANTITVNDAELAAERDVQWRAQEAAQLAAEKFELDEQIEQARAALKHSNVQLASLQAALRQLTSEKQGQRVAALSEEIEELAKHIDESAELRDQRSRQLIALLQQVDDTQAEMQKLRQRGELPRSYAVIPYEGANETRRKPIYLECRDGRLIVQPHGIILTKKDLEPLPGMANSLVVLLRTIASYWQDRHELTDDSFPYPLLLVRPSGAEVYGLVRNAMKSWDAEFGYELLSPDVPLVFPKSEAALTRGLQGLLVQVRNQRQRYRELRRPAAIAGGGSDGPIYRATGGRGGFVATTGPGSAGSGGELEEPLQSGESSVPAGGFSHQPSEGPHGMTGRGRSRLLGRGRNGESVTHFQTSSSIFPPGASRGTSSDGSTSPGTDVANSETWSQGAASPSLTLAPPEARVKRTFSPSNDEHTGVANSAAGEKTPSAERSVTTDRQLSSWTPGLAPNSAHTTKSGTSSSSGGGSESCSQPPSSTVTSPGAPTADAPVPLSKSRGANWALNTHSSGAFGITRPIYLAVRPNTLFLSQTADFRGPLESIAIKGRAVDSIDPLVEAVSGIIRSWGIAGTGAYWKPILKLRVDPGAERIRDEITTLLAGSGMAIEGAQR